MPTGDKADFIVGKDYWLCRNPPNKPIVRRYVGWMEPTGNTWGGPMFCKVRTDGSLGVHELSDPKHVIGLVTEDGDADRG